MYTYMHGRIRAEANPSVAVLLKNKIKKVKRIAIFKGVANQGLQKKQI